MTPTLIIVPGLNDSGPQHWQTLWEHKYGAARVHQDDPDHPVPALWSQRLQEVVDATPGPLVLVGHSCGVLNIVHWAGTHAVPARVLGALLVAPTDAEQADMLDEVRPYAPVPLQPLPFPALVVASENDPYSAFTRAEQMAAAWEAELVTAGEAGHINVLSGHGEWEEGEVLLAECINAWK
ncbi:alpha/beta hydrolase [Deinococcus sonorensis]|uniref:Alpha/beta hydrolase n=2 Tax=Deinococcus sonorensis TaxID=309891 RepID=A0AAU7U717_9DEIO